MSRARLNMRRIQMALVGIRRFKRRFDEIKVGANHMGWLFSGPGTAAAGCKLPAWHPAAQPAPHLCTAAVTIHQHQTLLLHPPSLPLPRCRRGRSQSTAWRPWPPSASSASCPAWPSQPCWPGWSSLRWRRSPRMLVGGMGMGAGG